MIKGGAVYILTNQNNAVLYTGVTSNIIKRLYEHRTGVYKMSFTSKYAVTKLVYYQVFINIEDAIVREKQIKGGSRRKKEDLIELMSKHGKMKSIGTQLSYANGVMSNKLSLMKRNYNMKKIRKILT